MLYANAVKALCKTEKNAYFSLFTWNNGETLQEKQHHSP